MLKRGRVPVLFSIIMNSVIVAVMIVCAVLSLVKFKKGSRFFRYFTTLSNMLCALSAMAVIVAWASGGLPEWVVILKYVGTCAVTVTMLTVLLLLGPLSHEWKMLLSGGDLFLHLVNPLLAIESFVLFEKTATPAWVVALGVAPVVLYSALYLRNVVFARRWDDFYGFNVNGKWPASLCLMLTGAAVIAFALWVG